MMETHDSEALIPTLTSSTFRSRVLEAEGPVAVEFMSYGCGHCRALEPVLEKAAQELQPTEQVFRVNVAIEPDLAAAYDVNGTPTLIMFLGAREMGRVEGPKPHLSSLMRAVTEPFAT